MASSSEKLAASSSSSVLRHFNSLPQKQKESSTVAVANASSTVGNNKPASSSSSFGSLSGSVLDDEDLKFVRSLSATEDEPFCVDMLWANAEFVNEANGLPTSEAFNNSIRYCSDFTSEVICQAYGHTEYSVYDDPNEDDSLTYAKDACCMCGKLLMPLSFESILFFQSSRFT